MMHSVSAVLGTLGAVAVAAGALIYFAKRDNSDAFAMQQFIAFIFLVPGALLLLLALLLWAL